MSTTQIRGQLHHYVDSSNDHIVKTVFALFKTYNNYNEEDADVDIEEYYKEIDYAMGEFSKCNYKSHEEVETQILNKLK